MNPLTPLLAVALLIATVKTVTDFPAYVAAKQWSAVIKQIIAWVTGVALAFLLAASDLGVSIQATDTVSLASANRWTVALFGLAAASGASFTYQYLQARDTTQSAYVPPIVGQPKVMGSAATPDPKFAGVDEAAALDEKPPAYGINIPVPPES